MITVPARTAAIPKFPESGSQACVVKKLKPTVPRASLALRVRNNPTRAMIRSTELPALRITPLKMRS
jgi:hypothetical protein